MSPTTSPSPSRGSESESRVPVRIGSPVEATACSRPGVDWDGLSAVMLQSDSDWDWDWDGRLNERPPDSDWDWD